MNYPSSADCSTVVIARPWYNPIYDALWTERHIEVQNEQDFGISGASDFCREWLRNVHHGQPPRMFRQRTTHCPDGYGPLFSITGPDAPVKRMCVGLMPPALSYSIAIIGLATIEPGNSLSLRAKVTDSNNMPVAGALVKITVDAVANSGGHVHGDDSFADRRGVLSGIGPSIVAVTPTDANGNFNFTYKAPAVSGTYRFTASCTDKTCTPQGPNTMDVKIDGLIPLPVQNNLYRQIGQTSAHPDNHYLMPEAKDKALDLAEKYKNTFPNAPLLQYNDASLPWGGLLDIKQNWSTPHKEHRRGTVIDVRANRTANAIPPANYIKFERMVGELGGSFLHEDIGKSNEHYHVRFFNRSE